MLSGHSYLFTEKDLRLFMRDRIIKQVVPIKQDSEPIIIKFTDGYQITITHHARTLEDYAPYFSVSILDPDHRLVLQKQLHELNSDRKKSKRKGNPE